MLGGGSQPLLAGAYHLSRLPVPKLDMAGRLDGSRRPSRSHVFDTNMSGSNFDPKHPFTGYETPSPSCPVRSAVCLPQQHHTPNLFTCLCIRVLRMHCHESRVSKCPLNRDISCGVGQDPLQQTIRLLPGAWACSGDCDLTICPNQSLSGWALKPRATTTHSKEGVASRPSRELQHILGTLYSDEIRGTPHNVVVWARK